MSNYFYFFSIDDNFYNTIYGGFNIGNDRSLISLKGKYNCPKLIRKASSWKLPVPWIRGKILGEIYFNQMFSKMFSIKVTDMNTQNYYIIYARILQLYGPSLLTYLKKMDPNGYFVCYLGDVVNTFTFDINKVINQFDKVISYDKKDAKKHGMGFLQEPYSNPPKLMNFKIPIYDVVFIGSEKGRLNRIHRAYDYLTKNGYNCEFYISGVDDKQKKYDKIHYNQYLDYNDVLKITMQSRCILEILQDDADTTTTRYEEALIFKKYLLTDSPVLLKEKELPDNIICIDYDNMDSINKIYNSLDYDNRIYIEKFSIDTMLGSLMKLIEGD